VFFVLAVMFIGEELAAENACAKGDNACEQQGTSDFITFKEIHNGCICFVLKFAIQTFI
jgi:hypothetical protein